MALESLGQLEVALVNGSGAELAVARLVMDLRRGAGGQLSRAVLDPDVLLLLLLLLFVFLVLLLFGFLVLQVLFILLPLLIFVLVSHAHRLIRTDQE